VSVPEWTPDLVVDEDRARALIRARFSEIRADRVERLGQGWDNAAYLVDGTTVFRFPQRAIVAPLIETEIVMLPALAPLLPLAIPVPRWIGVPDGSYPWHFAGYELLHGTPLDIANPDDAARSALARPLARFLRALHAIDPARYVAAGLPRDLIGRLDAVKRNPIAAGRLDTLVDAAAITRADASALNAMLERDAPREVPERLVVVHGDLYARHLLLDDANGLVAVIDWGDVHHGDPAADLMIAHEILRQREHDDFIAEYGAISETTWRRARWRGLYHAILVADYGLAVGDQPLARSGLAAIRRIRGSAVAEVERPGPT
jgi:aminoglycoside phosphotransferase (APT) family kinase protein